MDDNLGFKDATAQAEMVRTGEASPIELVESAIARIGKVNPELNAVIHERFDAARHEAAGELAGPFAGVPVLLKDLGAAMAGEPHHQGLGFAKAAGYRASADSHIVRKLQQAGFVILGRTNTPELGMNITTEPVSYGASRNPWSTDHTTGGSSGGSAAAVASGMVPIAHGNDGGGSIRIPASNCGLVGLKPSRGRVSSGPQSGDAASAGTMIDHVLTRTVRDSAALLDVLAGEMPGDLYVAPPQARPFAAEVGEAPGFLKVGVLDKPADERYKCHAECSAAANEAARLLESLGHKVDEAHPAALGNPDFQRNFELLFLDVEMAYDLEAWSELLGRRVAPEELEPIDQIFYAAGSAIESTKYISTLVWFEDWRRTVARFWVDDGYDLLVSPVLAVPPARIGELSDTVLGWQRMTEALQFTAQFNITGQPAISLPLHMTADGLPVGVQIVAAYGREDVLIRVASQLEQAAPWAQRKPPVHA